MHSKHQKDMNESLVKIESVFVPGQLRDKREEIIHLRENGDTMLFSGEVKWSVTLPDDDKRLNGHSESLDDAFGDMSNCLNFLANDYAEDTQVICSIEHAAEPRGESA